MGKAQSKAVFIFLFFSISIVPFLLPGEKINIQELYAEISGKYEFFIEERYIELKVYVDNGSLMGVVPGDDPVKFEPVNPEQLKFEAKEKEKHYFIRFIRNKDGKINRLTWLEKGKEKAYPAVRKEKNNTPLTFTARELQEDFQQMRRTIEKQHPAVYEFIDKRSFDRLFDRQFKLLNKPMSIDQFYRVTAPLVARIGCGHSSIRTPDYYWGKAPGKLLPLELHFINGKAYVLKIFGPQCSVSPGSEMITINRLPVSRIAEKLKAVIPADGYNDSYRTYRINQIFPYLYALFYGFPDAFTVTYKGPGQTNEQHTVLKTVDLETIGKAMEKWKSILTFDLLEEKNTAVLTMNNFYYYRDREKFFIFIDDAFNKIHELNIKNLILDVRDNDGGDPFCTSHLLSYLAPKPVPYFIERYGKYAKLAEPVSLADKAFKGKLYILINGKCFSSTSHFCSLLRYHKIGTFIGTETGGTYTCNDDKRLTHLKNTRFRLQIARGTFATAVKEMSKNRGIIPHYPVEPTIEDLLKGRDTVKEFALNLIQKKQ